MGLSIHDTSGTLNTGTAVRVGFRAAVASEVVVGDVHFNNVSFAVFPDDQEPWSDLPVGRRGLIGIPIVLGLRSLSPLSTRARKLRISMRTLPRRSRVS